MKYSFIVPCYNVEKYVEDCIKSLLNQDYDNYEIILVNDGSTDNTSEICKKYINKTVKYYIKENGGPSSARNYGIAKSTGDYLIFIDSDDIFEKNSLKLLNKLIIKYRCDILQFGFEPFFEGNKKFENADNVNKKFEVAIYNDKDKIMNAYVIDESITREAWNKVYKRSLFDNIEYPVGRIAEDLATTYKVLLKAENVVTIPIVLYHYRIRNNSIMQTGSTKLYHDAMVAHYEIYECLKDNKKYSKRLYSNYYNNLMKYYSKIINENDFEKQKEVKLMIEKINFQQLNLKGKIIFTMFNFNNNATLRIIYKKYILKGKVKK